MMTKICDLAYEIDGDTINLEQDLGCGEVSRIDLHPMHLRLLCAEAGLFKGDTDAWREVEKLSRRVRLLADRIEHLGQYLNLYSDSAHADLSYEQTYATATADLAAEFVADLPQCVGVGTGQDADAGNAVVTQGALPVSNAMQRQATPHNAKQGSLSLEVKQ
ncbi:MAG: hypothetical protein K0Q43_1862 [Ramlibacter sp.]|jgi:hypothetical protein|nr:hypothetical protein [Ramlibacter sp.]